MPGTGRPGAPVAIPRVRNELLDVMQPSIARVNSIWTTRIWGTCHRALFSAHPATRDNTQCFPAGNVGVILGKTGREDGEQNKITMLMYLKKGTIIALGVTVVAQVLLVPRILSHLHASTAGRLQRRVAVGNPLYERDEANSTLHTPQPRCSSNVFNAQTDLSADVQAMHESHPLTTTRDVESFPALTQRQMYPGRSISANVMPNSITIVGAHGSDDANVVYRRTIERTKKFAGEKRAHESDGDASPRKRARK